MIEIKGELICGIPYIFNIARDAINRGKRPSMKGKAPFISQALFPQFIVSIITLLFLKIKTLIILVKL